MVKVWLRRCDACLCDYNLKMCPFCDILYFSGQSEGVSVSSAAQVGTEATDIVFHSRATFGPVGCAISV